MPKRKYYAVAVGRTPGVIFDTWDECQPNVHSFSGSVHKSFTTREAAASFLASHGVAERSAGTDLSNDDDNEGWDRAARGYGQLPRAVTATSGLLDIRPVAGATRRARSSFEPAPRAEYEDSETPCDEQQTQEHSAELLSAVEGRLREMAPASIDANRTYRLVWS